MNGPLDKVSTVCLPLLSFSFDVGTRQLFLELLIRSIPVWRKHTRLLTKATIVRLVDKFTMARMILYSKKTCDVAAQLDAFNTKKFFIFTEDSNYK